MIDVWATTSVKVIGYVKSDRRLSTDEKGFALCKQ